MPQEEIKGVGGTLSLFVFGPVVELDRQGLLQHTITAKVGGKTFVWIPQIIIKVMELEGQVEDPK